MYHNIFVLIHLNLFGGGEYGLKTGKASTRSTTDPYVTFTINLGPILASFEAEKKQNKKKKQKKKQQKTVAWQLSFQMLMVL